MRVSRWVTLGLDVRSGPDASYSRLQTLQGHSIWHRIVGKDARHPKWWRIQVSSGTFGWIHAIHVDTRGDLSGVTVQTAGSPVPANQGSSGEATPVRSRSLPADLVCRARIVLLCAAGLDNSAVAARLRVSRQTVGRWRERFRTQGLMGLYDERRPGRPRSIPDDTVMTLLRKTLETPPDGSTHWTCRSMAAATGVSKSTVQRL